MKILNLYSCLGGNRYLWDNCQVTAVELDIDLANLYQKRFPNDQVIITDAHKYLLDHYQEYDFIWSSPPCPSHSRARFWGFGANGKNPIYPDLQLYEEVIFLQTHFKGKVVENVISYYEPLIKPIKRGRHFYWTNFDLPNVLSDRKLDIGIGQGKNEVKRLSEFHEFDFAKYKGKQRVDKIARNLVDYEAGKTILDVARKTYKEKNNNQIRLF